MFGLSSRLTTFSTNKEEIAMGDRANIEIREGEKSFFFYTHWGGRDLPKMLQEGLSLGRTRWDDPPYLSRGVL